MGRKMVYRSVLYKKEWQITSTHKQNNKNFITLLLGWDLANEYQFSNLWFPTSILAVFRLAGTGFSAVKPGSSDSAKVWLLLICKV